MTYQKPVGHAPGAASSVLVGTGRETWSKTAGEEKRPSRDRRDLRWPHLDRLGVTALDLAELSRTQYDNR